MKMIKIGSWVDQAENCLFQDSGIESFISFLLIGGFDLWFGG